MECRLYTEANSYYLLLLLKSKVEWMIHKFQYYSAQYNSDLNPFV